MILEHGEGAECRVAEPWAESTLPGCGRLERIRLGTPSCWLFSSPSCVGSTCIPNLSTLSANRHQLPRGWVSSSDGHLSPGVCWFPSVAYTPGQGIPFCVIFPSPSTGSRLTVPLSPTPAMGFPGGSGGKGPACKWKRRKRHCSDHWVGKIPGTRKGQPTLVFLPGKLRGQRSLAG